MKKMIILSLGVASMASCGIGNRSDYNDDGTGNKAIITTPSTYDPNRGEGKFTDVELGSSLDKAKADVGYQLYGTKCIGCHKLTDEKLVGPGWAAVTSRHAPVWIMNFITNTDDMINKDSIVNAELKICLVRMPNQNLSDEDARDVLEFMRKNDGIK